MSTPTDTAEVQEAQQAAAQPISPMATAIASTQAVKPPPFLITNPARTERYLKCIFYGGYGAGKTTLAASSYDAPTMRDILYIDAEAGDMSLMNRPGIDVVRINSQKQLARVFEYLRMHCRLRDDNDLDGLAKLESRVRSSDVSTQDAKRYKTVVIDSLSEVYKYVMYSLLGIGIGDRALDQIPDTPQFKEWGQAGEIVRLGVRSFRDLPMNVIFVSSEKTEEDDRKQQLSRLNFPGKLGPELQGFVDVVGYLASALGTDDEGKEIIKRRLYLQPGKTFQAKSRFATERIPFIDNPSMPALLKALGLA